MSNLYSADSIVAKIYQHAGFTTTITSSIATPLSDPAGNAIDISGNQYSNNLATQRLFKHAGFTTTITTSIASPDTLPSSCGVDVSDNFYSGDRNVDKYFKHAGFTTTITTSIASPDTAPRGGNINRAGDFYSTDSVALKIYRHSGFTTTITSSIATPNTGPRGVTVDSVGNVISNDVTADKFYLHQGFSTTITTSIATPAADVKGGEWETRLITTHAKTNTGAIASAGLLKRKTLKILIAAISSIVGALTSKLVFTKLLTGTIASAGALKRKTLKRVVGTVTSAGAIHKKTKRLLAGTVASAGTIIKKTKRLLTGSIASTGAVSDSLTNDLDGLLSVDATAQKIYQHAGFTTTITSSISSPSTLPTGVAWNNSADKLYTSDANSDKSYRHTGFSTTIEASISMTADPRGLSIDADGKLLSALSGAVDKYQRHNGFTTTIESSFSIDIDPRGLSWWRDGNAYASDNATVKHYKMSGFSSTITSSFTGTRIDGSCITQAGDIVESQLTNSKFVRYIGFSSSIRDSISSPGASARGVEWKKRLTGDVHNKSISGVVALAGVLKRKTLKIVAGAIASAGVIRKKIKRTLTASIAIAGALAGESIVIIRHTITGVIGLSGEVTTNTHFLIKKIIAGIVGLSGDVRGGSVFKRTLTGVVASSGQASKKAFKKLTGTIASAGALISSGALAILRYALDEQNPSVDGTVKYLVEMRSDSMPDGGLTDDSLYVKALRQVPEFQKNLGSARGGVSGLSRVSLSLSNLDGKFNNRDFDGFFVRVWRVLAAQVIEFKGVITEWTLGRELDVVVEDREAVVFNEQLPRRVYTKEGFPKLPDKDAGKVLSVIHNRVRNAPLRLIGVDLAARNWDYGCGEGVGKFGNFQDAVTIYFHEAALSDISGTVSSASGSTVTVEAADSRPVGFYQFQWIQILDATTLAVLDEIDITTHNSERIVGLSRSPLVSASGKKYRIRQFRFFNGSQATPYPGVAFIRLKKHLGEGDTLDELYGDFIGLPAANVVRELEDWLTNATWGFGLEINQAAFDALAADSQISNIKTEWGAFEKMDSGNIVEDLLSTYGMGLLKNDTELSIEADGAKSLAGTFGYADGFYDNIYSFSGLRHVHTNEKVKRLTINYRKNYKENNSFIGTQSAAVNASGVEDTIFWPYFYEHEDANRFLYYRIKKLISDSQRMNITVGEEGESLRARDRIRVKIPLINLDADFLIVSIGRANGQYRLELRPYDATTYTWSQLGSYPDESTTSIPPNYERTHPAPVSGLSVVVGYTPQEEGNRIGWADLSFTPPNDGNYLETVGSVKLNGQPSTSYVERAKGVTKIHIEPLEVGQVYDFLAESLNKYGLKGLKIEALNRLIPGDNTIPKAPTSVVPKGKLNRVAWEFNAVTQNTDNTAITDLRGYQYRVWSLASGGVQRYPKDGGFGFTTDTRVEITDTDGDLTTNKRTLYFEVRAIDRSGNVSALTTRVASSTSDIKQDDILDREITAVFRDVISGPTSSNLIIDGNLTVRGGQPVDVDFSFVVTTSAGSQLGAVIRDGSSVLHNANGTYDRGPFHIKVVDPSPPAGSRNYRLTIALAGSLGLISGRTIALEERRR